MSIMQDFSVQNAILLCLPVYRRHRRPIILSCGIVVSSNKQMVTIIANAIHQCLFRQCNRDFCTYEAALSSSKIHYESALSETFKFTEH